MSLGPIDKIIRARLGLQKQTYFLYGAIMHSRYRLTTEEEAKQITTAAADARGNIIVNPDFITDKGDDFMEPLMMHEALHIVLMHTVQIQTRHHDIFNVAADIKVNQYIREYGYSIDSDWLHADEQGVFQHDKLRVEDCNNKSAIEIYDELMKQVPKVKVSIIGPGSGNNSTQHDWDVAFDEDGTSHEMNAEERESVRQDILDRIRSAHQEAKMRGSIPGGLERRLNELLESRLPWNLILNRWVQQVIPVGYSYRMPHKKSFSTGYYMPQTVKENLEIIWTFDTSGSMSDQSLVDGLSECFGSARRFRNVEMKVIIVDCQIQDVYSIGSSNLNKIKDMVLRGGGGTSHIPVYEYIKEKRLKPALVINFTDGYTQFPPKDMVRAPTLWVISKDGVSLDQIPFGEKVKM